MISHPPTVWKTFSWAKIARYYHFWTVARRCGSHWPTAHRSLSPSKAARRNASKTACHGRKRLAMHLVMASKLSTRPSTWPALHHHRSAITSPCCIRNSSATRCSTHVHSPAAAYLRTSTATVRATFPAPSPWWASTRGTIVWKSSPKCPAHSPAPRYINTCWVWTNNRAQFNWTVSAWTRI